MADNLRACARERERGRKKEVEKGEREKEKKKKLWSDFDSEHYFKDQI